MNLANRITIARIVSIPFFIASVVYSRPDIALIIFILAALSDAVDGFIARALKQKTPLGTVLDPIADKLLLLSAYICLTMVGAVPGILRLPPYITITVLSRDAIIVLGSMVIFFITGDLKVAPSPVGKVTTVFQMLTVIAALLQFRYSHAVWNVTILLTVISGIDYIIKGSRLLNGAQSQKKG